MSSRKYLPHLKSITLMASIASPADGLSRDGFGHEQYRFFIEAGFFCIESKKSGRVADVPPSQIRQRMWFNEAELAELEAKAAVTAVAKAAAEASSP